MVGSSVVELLVETSIGTNRHGVTWRCISTSTDGNSVCLSGQGIRTYGHRLRSQCFCVSTSRQRVCSRGIRTSAQCYTRDCTCVHFGSVTNGYARVGQLVNECVIAHCDSVVAGHGCCIGTNGDAVRGVGATCIVVGGFGIFTHGNVLVTTADSAITNGYGALTITDQCGVGAIINNISIVLSASLCVRAQRNSPHRFRVHIGTFTQRHSVVSVNSGFVTHSHRVVTVSDGLWTYSHSISARCFGVRQGRVSVEILDTSATVDVSDGGVEGVEVR